ncbi:beta-1,3-galactosyltransferase 5 [Lycorma delicatula]|uniref:beta-1,3-galactosyltransferase 5 n=1 Tax=Lycorma delicatula TaxID=130591 RepID=UPI003F510754
MLMIEKKPRSLPLIGVAILTGFVCLTFWRLHLQRRDSPSSFASDRSRVLQGPYRLLRSDNVSMEPSPYRIDRSHLPPDDLHQLIDLNNFTFTMNDPAALCNVSNTPLVLAVVHSTPKHFSNRKAIRKTWGRDINVVFLVGETDNITQQLLNDENSKHNDIIQGSFIDAYRNLTYKHVMGLKWLTYYCRTARYILKLDDDVFVNSRNLNDLLVRQLSPLGARRLILCKLLPSSVAKRTYRSKWRVTPAEYPGRWYPGYCPGWAVLYSPDVVFALYCEAQRSPYFWIDDVHITGTLVAQANLSHTSLGLQSYLWADDKEHLQNHKADFVVGLTEHYEFNDLWETLVS